MTGVFFDLSSSSNLTPVSALLTEGSHVLFSKNQPVGGNVGGEWAFKSGLHGAPGNANYGISATGLNLFGPHDRFSDYNLNKQENVGGMDFGILSAGDDHSTGNKPVTGHNELIHNSVTFTLNGFSELVDAGDVCNVRFQYGTSLSEPSFLGGGGGGGGGGREIPEPGTAALLTLGAAALIRMRRRKIA